tara:strand:+ start:671 stop:898 length:228 start_codon:yes stop_codon:yes gene_type:complete
MSEEKSVRQLERELKAARVRELADHQSKITVNRDFAPIGVDRDNVRKDTQTSTSTPDAIRLPPKRQSKKPNQPYY